MPSRICIIVSLVEKSLPLEWVTARLSKKYEVTVVLLNPARTALSDFLEAHHIRNVLFRYRSKRDMPRTLWSLVRWLRKERFDVVHTHLLDATLIGLTAAWCAGVKKRIYTRHNSTFHQNYFPRSVALDKWCNRLATHIISLSQATDYALAAEHVAATRIRRAPHGFDFAQFLTMEDNRKRFVREKWKIPEGHPRIGVVARWIEWKGVQYAIAAFRELLRDYPDAVLILANAQGPYAPMLRAQLKEIPQGRAVEIPFEEDIAAVYLMMDVFVHVPVDHYCEAFGQTYIEAWSLGIPSVVSASGIAAEVARHKVNTWLVGYQDAAGIVDGLRAVLSDAELRTRITHAAREAALNGFSLDTTMPLLEAVYDE